MSKLRNSPVNTR